MSVLSTDVFTAADGTTLPAYNAAKWKNPNSGTWNNLVIKNNAVRGSSSGLGGNIDISISWPNDQYAQAVVKNLASARQWVTVRWADGTNNFYGGGIAPSVGGNGYRIFRQNGGVTLAGPTGTMTIGDKVKLVISGTSLSLYVNDALLLGPVTDATHASGNPGLNIDDGVGVNEMWDDYEAGDLGTPPRVPLRYTLRPQ
jgi:hypothetical protein